MATAILYCYYIVPDVETMKTLRWSWALWLYAVNAAGIFAMYGSIEFFYYVKRRQGTRFKYNGKFPRTIRQMYSGSRAKTSTTSCEAT